MNKRCAPLAEASLRASLVEEAVKRALSEDLGLIGDLTSNATIPIDARAKCQIAARHDGVIAGLDVARAAFYCIDREISFTAKRRDGASVAAGSLVATIAGNARAILAGERVALNFLGRLSGIATLTRSYVDKIAGTRAQIVDTRKTTPGLRAFEKYAVRCGGAMNHRAGLFDAILIKDNHIAIAGSLGKAISAAKASGGHMVKIEVEVDRLDQLAQALEHDIDAVLLDNMSLNQLRDGVALVDGRVLVEASGGVSLDTVGAIARTGVDLISVGALTHSAPVFDLGLDFMAAG